MSANTKIAVHSLSGNHIHLCLPISNLCANPIPDLKNTTDDALPNYLTSLKFRQSHTQTDIRLFLGYSAVAIAGTLFYFDWKHGWDATKAYTAPAVIAYFIINGIFSYWIWAVEKGVVFAGEGKTGKVSFQTLRPCNSGNTPCLVCREVEIVPYAEELLA
jgi:Microsomal signal peptidase 25 kDa subunit (SPC25)